jgi:aminopeptidase N
MRWDNYRDQWINEGLSNYLAVLYADAKKPSDHGLNYWLQRYRDELAGKAPGQDERAEEVGPLVLGYRLGSSKSPRGFDHVMYPKGTWVFHMLRMMLRDPAAKASKPLAAGLESDARFVQLLHAMVEKYRNRSLSTEDLQREVEAVMTPAMDLEGSHSMDWFFDEWVRSADIPRYSVEFTLRPQGKNFLVRGTLQQSGVAENFVAAVPLYAARPGGKPVLLGTVVTSGAATPFQFVSRVPIKRILIDPQLTLLCYTK